MSADRDGYKYGINVRIGPSSELATLGVQPFTYQLYGQNVTGARLIARMSEPAAVASLMKGLRINGSSMIVDETPVSGNTQPNGSNQAGLTPLRNEQSSGCSVQLRVVHIHQGQAPGSTGGWTNTFSEIYAPPVDLLLSDKYLLSGSQYHNHVHDFDKHSGAKRDVKKQDAFFLLVDVTPVYQPVSGVAVPIQLSMDALWWHEQ